MNERILSKAHIQTKTIAFLITIVSAVALPQIFHAVGIISGEGALLGTAFLPMHIPVLVAGFMAGPVVGLLAGVASPLLSALLTGMPASPMIPNMIVELAGYGVMAGMLANVKMPVLPKVLLAQLAGRILKAGVILISVYLIGFTTVPTATIWTSVRTGLPGLLLQWLTIPLIVYWMNEKKKGLQ